MRIHTYQSTPKQLFWSEATPKDLSLSMKEVLLASAQFFLFLRSLLVIPCGLFCTFQTETPGVEGSHCSEHEADSTHEESHLAKVQGEHISSVGTCGQPAEIPAVKVFSALPHGLGTYTDWPGWKSGVRTRWCCSGVFPVRCQPNVA